MRIERVDFVDIPSRDVERSIAFYRDVLELPQNPREPTEFEAGNLTLAIWKPEDQGVEFSSGGSHGIARASATWPSSPTRTETR
jgi:catechol 2,3-dioxygenase-like lactoylglutathione lyase family enzyme